MNKVDNINTILFNIRAENSDVVKEITKHRLNLAALEFRLEINILTVNNLETCLLIEQPEDILDSEIII